MKRNLQSRRTPSCRTKVLAEAQITLLPLSLVYRLEWGRRDGESGFWVTVETASDMARAWLGDDVTYAVSCYEQIKRGCVTPCTLQEIVEELFERGA